MMNPADQARLLALCLAVIGLEAGELESDTGFSRDETLSIEERHRERTLRGPLMPVLRTALATRRRPRG